MDSLLATYASSEEEDDQQQSTKQNQSTQSDFPKSKFGGKNFSSSKPNQFGRSDSSSSKSLFSKLPQPKSERSDPFSINPNPKKVVQFRPPIINKVIDDDDDDDDDDLKKEQPKKDNLIPETPSVKSFLSSIPAPRNYGSLGSGMGRRSILAAEVSGLSNLNSGKDSVNNAGDNQVNNDNNNNTYSEYANIGVNETVNVVRSADYVSYDYSSYGPAAPVSDDHVNYGSYEGYSDYGQYESKWIDRLSGNSVQPEVSVAAAIQSVARVPGKRGRNEIPQEVIEVSQDELMKNRPREDQVKATGIAFGPSYQPTSSTKGKPTKQHKRKHQIGSLYFDMRSKETELAERRSKGFLTKAETQAKYGW